MFEETVPGLTHKMRLISQLNQSRADAALLDKHPIFLGGRVPGEQFPPGVKNLLEKAGGLGGQMAQPVKFLLCKPEDPRLTPEHPCKILIMSFISAIPAPKWQRDGFLLGAGHPVYSTH